MGAGRKPGSSSRSSRLVESRSRLACLPLLRPRCLLTPAGQPRLVKTMANSLLHERLTDHRRKQKPPCSCQVERAITSLRCSLLSGASLPASANFFRRTLGKEQQLPRVRSTTVPHRKARFRGLHVVDAGNLRTSSCSPSSASDTGQSPPCWCSGNTRRETWPRLAHCRIC